MSIFLKPLSMREELLKRNLRIFTPLDFQRVFQINTHRMRYFLEEQTKQKLFVRLKKGLYALKTDLPGEEEIANRLYQPSYLSFEYALAFYNILPEMPYQITSATTKTTRAFSIDGKAFGYFKIKTQAYTGYHLKQFTDKQFLIAESEKAVVDYLYFVVLGKKSLNERLDLYALDKEKAVFYAGLYQKERLMDLVKKLL